MKIIRLSVFCIIATDVEKQKDVYSAKECRLRKLVSEMELLTAQQQKHQQGLNAKVVSVGLLSADVSQLNEEIAVYLQSMLVDFYRASSALAVYAMVVCPSVCPSVCLSQVGVLLKRLNVG